MKTIHVDMILEDNTDTEYFVTQVLPKLKKEHKMISVFYHKSNYFEM